jgi:D-glycerate 3-kinase
MATDTRATAYKAKLIADFIASNRAKLRDAPGRNSSVDRPLMVSMQGPQGCGKSTLAAALMDIVEKDYGLKIAVASLDGMFIADSSLCFGDSASMQRLPRGYRDIQLVRWRRGD